MTAPGPRTIGKVTLTPEHGRQLWNWTLHRQGLHPDHRLSTAAQIAHAGLGVHAARLPSPYATILARAAGPRTALSVLAAHDGLTTLRCMRKTLHLLPLDLAAVAHAATSHYRTRDAARLAHNAALPASTVAHLTRQLLAVLADGPMPHRRIESTLATARHPVTAVRVALKIAWERGDVTYLNQSGCWNQEHRAFGLTSALHPGLNIDVDRAQATRALVEAYFDRYGPATIKDAMWWSALSRSAITSAMSASGSGWVEIGTPWAAAPAYMPTTRYDDFLHADPSTFVSGVNLLAHEDVALKAYFETRDRYLDGLPPRTAFNQIGEALPTIVIDGIVHGTWAWNPATRAATTLLAPGRARGHVRRVQTASDVLTDALRAGWRARDTSERNVHADQLALIV